MLLLLLLHFYADTKYLLVFDGPSEDFAIQLLSFTIRRTVNGRGKCRVTQNTSDDSIITPYMTSADPIKRTLFGIELTQNKT